VAKCGSCGARVCRNGSDCSFLSKGSCNFCHCEDESEDSDYIEVKCHTGKLDSGDAKDFIERGYVGILAGGLITGPAKKLLDDAGIWYQEEVDPYEMEQEVEDGVAEY
jgi:hypothetical protein